MADPGAGDDYGTGMLTSTRVLIGALLLPGVVVVFIVGATFAIVTLLRIARAAIFAENDVAMVRLVQLIAAIGKAAHRSRR
jgi:hypothetical protein